MVRKAPTSALVPLTVSLIPQEKVGRGEHHTEAHAWPAGSAQQAKGNAALWQGP